MLVKHIAQVFYVADTTNKRLKVVIPRKRWILGVENAVDEEEFDQFDEIPPFVTSMIKQGIPSTNKAPYSRNDHHEKVKNFKKPRPQWKVAKWLCKICSMCENMTICVKIWLSLDIRVKYAQCVKICTSYFQSLKPSDCCMFKSWWAWVIIDEVRLNF
jgi:hypothetical protein